MNFRQTILVGIGIFLSMLVADGIYTYYHPAVVQSGLYLLSKVILSVSFCIGGFYTVWALKKNITTKIKAEQRAIVQEGRYRKIVEESGITTIATDIDGVIKFVSKNVERLSGYTPEEMTGLSVTDCMPIEFRDSVALLIENASSDSEYNTTIEIQIFTKEQKNKWVGCRLYNISDGEGRLKELQFMIWDNDYSKLLELELRSLEQERIKQQNLLQAVVDTNPNIIYIKNMQGEYVLTNKKMRELTDYIIHGSKVTEKEIFKSANDRLFEYQTHDRDVIENKKIVAFEDSFPYQDGIKHLYVMKFPMFDENGNVEYICGVSVDITELKNTQIQMLEAREEAMQAKEAQENFLANMSHEIRTPMNGVMGMSNLLLETTLNSDQKEYVQSIKESAENLLGIINDLLDFSKIKSGKFHIDEHDFDIADTVRKAIYPLQVKAQEKNLSFHCFIDTIVPENVVGDALRLQQMLINLVANAIKFTTKGSINIKVFPIEQSKEEVLLCLEVADTGIGIDESKLNKVFELYTQSDKNTSRMYGGTGLGLAIVKQLAELQNGKVNVRSKPGEGSVFTIQIPYRIKYITGKTKQPAPKNLYANGLLQGLKILVAEDNLINQKVVLYTLKNQGAEVSMANNGKEAVSILHNGFYDLILMDLQMPEMDGYQATQYIRSSLNIHTPIIAMTADAMKGESEKCIAAGMQDYVSKPFEPDELFTKILSHTNRS